MSLTFALAIDGVCVVLAIVAVLRSRQLSVLHPGLLYLIFHVSLYSARAVAVHNGSQTYLDVQPERVADFLLLADAFLIVFTWFVGSSRVNRESLVSAKGSSGARKDAVQYRNVVLVGVAAVPVGVVSFLTTGFTPGLGTIGAGPVTSYQTFAIIWPLLIICALIFVRGARLAYLIPFWAYAVLLGVQGHSRFRVVIPVVLLGFVLLARLRRNWPTWRMLVVGLILVTLFPVLKSVGMEIREGEFEWDVFIEQYSDTRTELREGSNREQWILDQGAIVKQLVDERDSFFYGQQYVSFFTLPVPRIFWSNKPGMADHLAALESARFPIKQAGAVTTLPGDLYLNFGWLGVLVGAALLGRVLGAAYTRACASAWNSPRAFVYLLIAACAVQYYRDGVVSLLFFPMVFCLPWLIIARVASRAHVPEHKRDSALTGELK